MSFEPPKYLKDYLTSAKYRKPIVNFINNSTYYSQVNYQWQYYMQNVVRPCIAYSTGAVDGVSNQLLASNTGMAICQSASRLIVGDKTFFIGDDLSCRFLSDIWIGKQNLPRFLIKAYSYMFQAGTSVIKWNRDERDWNTLTAHRLDRTFISTNENGEVVGAVFFISLFSKMGNGEEDTYWLVEERKYNEKGEKVVSYKVFMKSGVENSPNLPSPYQKGICYNRLPLMVKKEVDRYGIKKLNDEIPLPAHDGLGVWLMSKTATNSCIPECEFGDPLLYGCLDLLWSVDIVYSGSLIDVLNGEGKILVPKMFLQETLQRLQNANPNTSFNITTAELSHYHDEQFVYIQPSGFDKEKQSPTPVQFDIRADQYTKMWELYERAICVRAGFSPTSIFPYLGADNSIKTATEVTAEENLTRATIRDIHNLTTPVIDRAIQEVLYQEGFSLDCHIQLSDYVGNKYTFDENVRQNVAQGLTPKKVAIKQVNNLNDSEAEEYTAEIVKEAKQLNMFDALSTEGYAGNAIEPTA